MVDRSQLRRMIGSMERALTRMEEEQQARHDAEDRELKEELARGNTMPTPTQPFSDGAPQRIHGEGKRDLFK
jgi:hypothetical protein